MGAPPSAEGPRRTTRTTRRPSYSDLIVDNEDEAEVKIARRHTPGSLHRPRDSGLPPTSGHGGTGGTKGHGLVGGDKGNAEYLPEPRSRSERRPGGRWRHPPTAGQRGNPAGRGARIHKHSYSDLIPVDLEREHETSSRPPPPGPGSSQGQVPHIRRQSPSALSGRFLPPPADIDRGKQADKEDEEGCAHLDQGAAAAGNGGPIRPRGEAGWGTRPTGAGADSRTWICLHTHHHHYWLRSGSITPRRNADRTQPAKQTKRQQRCPSGSNITGYRRQGLEPVDSHKGIAEQGLFPSQHAAERVAEVRAPSANSKGRYCINPDRDTAHILPSPSVSGNAAAMQLSPVRILRPGPRQQHQPNRRSVIPDEPHTPVVGQQPRRGGSACGRADGNGKITGHHHRHPRKQKLDPKPDPEPGKIPIRGALGSGGQPRAKPETGATGIRRRRRRHRRSFGADRARAAEPQ